MKMPAIFALLYRYEGKTILLVRKPHYMPMDPDASQAAYKALLAQYESLADVLVIDQTHNPGGSIADAESFFRLFAQGGELGFVQAMHADRQWISAFRDLAAGVDPALQSEKSRAFLLRAATVEAAYDKGEALTRPIPLLSEEHIEKSVDYSWTKPVLVLTDELAGSCGDIVPMLFQSNGRAKLFGRRTMGLGGNVEPAAILANSLASTNLTRGLFTTFRADAKYSDDDLVENNGIQPDYPFELTVDDVRNGYIEYVRAFSKKAVEQTGGEL